MSKSDFVKEWNTKIELGIKYKEKFTDMANYERYRAWYRGDFGDAEVTGITRPVNRIFSYIKGMVPRAYFRSPSVVVTPLRPEMKWHAMVMEAVDNYLIRATNIKKTMRIAAMSAGITGMGPIKLGFDSEFGFIPEQAVDENMGTVTQVSTKTGDRIEYSDYIKPGLPWAMNTPSEDVITPYGYQDSDTFPWICHLIVRPLEDVQHDQKYKNTKDLKGGYITSIADKLKKKQWIQSEWKEDPYCLLYEVRDKKTKKVYVFCEDELLLDYDDALQQDGLLPWEFVIFNDDPNYFGGIPDVRLIAPQQAEINEIRTQASKMRKFSLLKFLYQRGAMTPEDLDKLLSDNIDDIGAGIPVDAESLQAAILPLIPHGLVQELRMEMSAVEADMMRTIGMGENQEGRMSPLSGKTASEAMITNQGSEVRMNERRDHMADILGRILTKFNHYIWDFWTQEKVVEIVGPDYAKYWISYTGDQLRGDYLIKVDADSGLPVTRGLRYEQAMQLFNMLKGHPLINQQELVKVLLQPFEWIDPSYSMLVQQPPAPMPGTGSPGISMPQMQMSGQGPGQGVGGGGSRSAKTIPFDKMSQAFGGVH